jgi:hypothetical protein
MPLAASRWQWYRRLVVHVRIWQIKEFMVAMLFEFRAYLYPYTVQIHDESELSAQAARLDEFARGFVAMVTRLAA